MPRQPLQRISKCSAAAKFPSPQPPPQTGERERRAADEVDAKLPRIPPELRSHGSHRGRHRRSDRYVPGSRLAHGPLSRNRRDRGARSASTRDPAAKASTRPWRVCARACPTLFIGAIGDDHLGAIARRFGEDEGLPCRWLVVDDAPTAASSIVVDADRREPAGRESRRQRAARSRFRRGAGRRVRGAKILLVQLENNLDAIAAALASASDTGCCACSTRRRCIPSSIRAAHAMRPDHAERNRVRPAARAHRRRARRGGDTRRAPEQRAACAGANARACRPSSYARRGGLLRFARRALGQARRRESVLSRARPKR